LWCRLEVWLFWKHTTSWFLLPLWVYELHSSMVTLMHLACPLCLCVQYSQPLTDYTGVVYPACKLSAISVVESAHLLELLNKILDTQSNWNFRETMNNWGILLKSTCHCYVPHPKFRLKLSPHCGGIKRPFRRWLGHKGFFFPCAWEWGLYKRGSTQSLIFLLFCSSAMRGHRILPLWGHSNEMSSWKQKEQPSPPVYGS
jgi:hypothetical protein